MEIKSLQSFININRMARKLAIADLCTKMATNPVGTTDEEIVKILAPHIGHYNEENVFGEIEAQMIMAVDDEMRRRGLHEDTIIEVLLDGVDFRMDLVRSAWEEYKEEVLAEKERKFNENLVMIEELTVGGVEND